MADSRTQTSPASRTTTGRGRLPPAPTLPRPPCVPESRRAWGSAPQPGVKGEPLPPRPAPSPYEATPAALERLAAHRGSVLVDFDGTLYLGSPVEDFLQLARPRLLASVALFLLNRVRPWWLVGGPVTRDAWRVWAVRMVLPWTGMRWRRRAAELAQEHGNRPLLQALRERTEPVILTGSSYALIRPLAAAMGLDGAQLLAPSFGGHHHNRLQAAVGALARQGVHPGMLVARSRQELPGHSRLRRGLSHRLKPFSLGHLRRALTREDLVLWSLCAFALAPEPRMLVAGLACLLVSFRALYELGAVNSGPQASLRPRARLSTMLAWTWALLLGGAAVYLLRGPGASQWEVAADLGRWTAVLVLTQGLGRLAASVNRSARLWLQAGLQLIRAGAFMVLVPVLPVAATAVAATTLGRWLPGYLFCAAGGRWPGMGSHLVRLLFFGILTALLACSSGTEILMGWTAPLLALWMTLRARRELVGLLRHVQLLKPQAARPQG